MSGRGLSGLRVVLFESRRQAELARLVERNGGVPVCAPTMREIPTHAGPEVIEFVSRLKRREFDIVLLLTGVGTRALASLLESGPEPLMPRAELSLHLSQCVVGARGPKTVAALKEVGVRNYITAPEPNTWRELVSAVKEHVPFSGKRVAVQEYGVAHPALIETLQNEGAEVLSVPVYRWSLPEDTSALEQAIVEVTDDKIDVALFTSAAQIDHALEVARRMECEERFLKALDSCVVGSIGPTCTERLLHYGITPDVVPLHAKMGHLVLAVAQHTVAED